MRAIIVGRGTFAEDACGWLVGNPEVVQKRAWSPRSRLMDRLARFVSISGLPVIRAVETFSGWLHKVNAASLRLSAKQWDGYMISAVWNLEGDSGSREIS